MPASGLLKEGLQAALMAIGVPGACGEASSSPRGAAQKPPKPPHAARVL